MTLMLGIQVLLFLYFNADTRLFVQIFFIKMIFQSTPKWFLIDLTAYA